MDAGAPLKPVPLCIPAGVNEEVEGKDCDAAAAGSQAATGAAASAAAAAGYQTASGAASLVPASAVLDSSPRKANILQGTEGIQ